MKPETKMTCAQFIITQKRSIGELKLFNQTIRSKSKLPENKDIRTYAEWSDKLNEFLNS